MSVEIPQLKILYLDSIFAESEFDLGLFSISHFATLCMIDLKHANMVIWVFEVSREESKLFLAEEILLYHGTTLGLKPHTREFGLAPTTGFS